MRGYDPRQVDEYVATLREGYQDMEREYKALEERSARLEAELAAQPDPAAISRALVDAQSVAKQITDRAQAQAEETLRQATAEAEKLVRNARMETERLATAKETIVRQLRGLVSALDRGDGRETL
jgi:cell division septum initiation protein DivIVA